MPLGELLNLGRQDVAPEHVAVFTRSGPPVTYGELAQLAKDAAVALQRLSAHSGARVVVCGGESIDTLIGILGCWVAGAVAVPVSAELTETELRHVIDDSGASLMLTTAAEPGFTVDGVPMLPISALLSPGGTTSHARERNKERPDDALLLLYTSGTTGPAKAVCHTRRTFQAVLDASGEVFDFEPSDRVISIAKMSFAYGFGATVLLALSRGASVILHERFGDPLEFWALVREQRATVVIGVPRLWASLLRLHSLGHIDCAPSVRRGVSAGEYMPTELRARVLDELGIDVWDIVGSTETLHGFLAREPWSATHKPMPGFVASVRDDAGEPVASGEIGELWVAEGAVADGYEGWAADASGTFGNFGFRTGDSVRSLADGRIQYICRSDDLLKLGGHRVAPQEVEAIVLSLPGVSACAVTPYLDENGLQDAVIHVVPLAGQESTIRDLVRIELHRVLASHRRPKRIRIVTELLVSRNGKLLRRELALEPGELFEA